MRALDDAGIQVARATGVPPTLDDVFLALTGRTLREAGEGEPSDGEEGGTADAGGAAVSASGSAETATEKTGASR